MGRITAISSQRRNPDRYSIFIDGEFVLGIDKKTIEDMDLRVGKLVDEKDLKKITSQEELNKAQAYALMLLGYRERSLREIEMRMRQKGYEEKLVEKVVKYLKDRNLINDKRFTQLWAESRIKKGYGKWRIQSELEQKGVNREITDEILKDLYSGIDEVQVALDLVEKKRWVSKEPPRLTERVSNLLRRRGFSFEVISNVVEKIHKT
ncbi:regulatory protein RecX [Candidatus Aerophobetes bacterium]|nr:regulatory protein RecX [Candidatus Aerophobetes bacterium]